MNFFVKNFRLRHTIKLGTELILNVTQHSCMTSCYTRPISHCMHESSFFVSNVTFLHSSAPKFLPSCHSIATYMYNYLVSYSVVFYRLPDKDTPRLPFELRLSLICYKLWHAEITLLSLHCVQLLITIASLAQVLQSVLLISQKLSTVLITINY